MTHDNAEVKVKIDTENFLKCTRRDKRRKKKAHTLYINTYKLKITSWEINA
jgi:hypothetical protein